MKLTGPMMSIDASGTFGGVITCAKWRGINYARRRVTPKLGTSTAQINMRLAVGLIAQMYRDDATEQQKTDYIAGAAGQKISGINLCMKRALESYLVDPGKAVTPTSVSVAGSYPADVYTWNA